MDINEGESPRARAMALALANGGRAVETPKAPIETLTPNTDKALWVAEQDAKRFASQGDYARAAGRSVGAALSSMGSGIPEAVGNLYESATRPSSMLGRFSSGFMGEPQASPETPKPAVPAATAKKAKVAAPSYDGSDYTAAATRPGQPAQALPTGGQRSLQFAADNGMVGGAMIPGTDIARGRTASGQRMFSGVGESYNPEKPQFSGTVTGQAQQGRLVPKEIALEEMRQQGALPGQQAQTALWGAQADNFMQQAAERKQKADAQKQYADTVRAKLENLPTSVAYKNADAAQKAWLQVHGAKNNNLTARIEALKALQNSRDEAVAAKAEQELAALGASGDYADGGYVEGYADGGAIGAPAAYGQTPQVSQVNPLVSQYGTYLRSASEHKLTPVPFEQFASLFGQARQTLSQQPTAGFANGGPITDVPVGGKLLDGPGDGRSDSIPAVIDGNRRAALSTGEFVIPEHIVRAKGTEFFEKLIRGNDNGSEAIRRTNGREVQPAR